MAYVNTLYDGSSGITSATYSVGAGLKYDGVANYVQTSNDFSFIQNTGIFTISFIFYPTITGRTIMATIGDSGNKGFLIYYDGNLYLGLAKGIFGNPIVSEIALTGVTINSLYHVFYCGDGIKTTYYLYDNNGLIQSNVGGNYNGLSTGASSSNLMIGRDLYGFFAGQTMYDLKIFDKCLSSNEVDRLAKTKSMIVPPTAKANLVSDWNFNQKTGTTLTDWSGNGNNGTLINYTALETNVGVNNKWVDELGNSILI